jgi:hypothetical protein
VASQPEQILLPRPMERNLDKGFNDKDGNRRLFVAQHIVDFRIIFMSERITHQHYLVGILLGYGHVYEPT